VRNMTYGEEDVRFAHPPPPPRFIPALAPAHPLEQPPRTPADFTREVAACIIQHHWRSRQAEVGIPRTPDAQHAAPSPPLVPSSAAKSSATRSSRRMGDHDWTNLSLSSLAEACAGGEGRLARASGSTCSVADSVQTSSGAASPASGRFPVAATADATDAALPADVTTSPQSPAPRGGPREVPSTRVDDESGGGSGSSGTASSSSGSDGVAALLARRRAAFEAQRAGGAKASIGGSVAPPSPAAAGAPLLTLRDERLRMRAREEHLSRESAEGSLPGRSPGCGNRSTRCSPARTSLPSLPSPAAAALSPAVAHAGGGPGLTGGPAPFAAPLPADHVPSAHLPTTSPLVPGPDGSPRDDLRSSRGAAAERTLADACSPPPPAASEPPHGELVVSPAMSASAASASALRYRPSTPDPLDGLPVADATEIAAEFAADATTPSAARRLRGPRIGAVLDADDRSSPLPSEDESCEGPLDVSPPPPPARERPVLSFFAGRGGMGGEPTASGAASDDVSDSMWGATTAAGEGDSRAGSRRGDSRAGMPILLRTAPAGDPLGVPSVPSFGARLDAAADSRAGSMVGSIVRSQCNDNIVEGDSCDDDVAGAAAGDIVVDVGESAASGAAAWGRAALAAGGNDDEAEAEEAATPLPGGPAANDSLSGLSETPAVPVPATGPTPPTVNHTARGYRAEDVGGGAGDGAGFHPGATPGKTEVRASLAALLEAEADAEVEMAAAGETEGEDQVGAILAFLDEAAAGTAAVADRRERAAAAAAAAAGPSTSFSTSSSGPDRTAALATAVLGGVREKLARLESQLDAARRREGALEQRLADAAQTAAEAHRAHAAEAEAREARQRAEHEEGTRRHLEFIDRLLGDKEDLANRADALAASLERARADAARATAELRAEFAAELGRQRGEWAAMEARDRDAWTKKREAEIKAATVRGLEPEVARLVGRNKTALRELEERLTRDFGAEKASLLDRARDEAREARRAADERLDAAVEAEREAGGRRLREARERASREAAEAARDAERAARDAAERAAEAASVEAEARGRRAAAAEAAEALATARADADAAIARAVADANAKAEARLEERAVAWATEQEAWRRAVADRARRTLREREASLEAELRETQKSEVEAMADRLEADFAARAEADRALMAREAEDERADLRAEIDRLGSLVASTSEARERAEGRARAATAGAEAAAERAALAEAREADARRAASELSRRLGESAAEADRAAAADREALHKAQRECQSLRARVVAELKAAEDLRESHAVTLREVDTRVRAAVARRDECIAGLRGELEALGRAAGVAGGRDGA